MRKQTRRDWLRVAGIGVVAGLAGCSSSGDDAEEEDEDDDEEEDEEEEEPRAAPQMTVECDLDGENPTITHAGGDSLERSELAVVDAGEGASLADGENGTYAAGDTIVEGGAGDITSGTGIVWEDPTSESTSVIAEC